MRCFNMAGLDESALRSSLQRLAEADILFVEGDGAQATYRFKHALIQDAAYDSLLKSRRQALHRRAAEIMCESASPEPEAVAHHFTQAGLDDRAIEWWGKAGDQALRRSAFQEAIAHLGKAIAMADKAAGAGSQTGVEAAAVSSQRLKLQTDYGQALIWSKGFIATETIAVLDRARELAQVHDNASTDLVELRVRWARPFMGGDLRVAREIAGKLLREAEISGSQRFQSIGHYILGYTCLWLGELADARTHLEYVRRDQSSDLRDAPVLGIGTDERAMSPVVLALASWASGDVALAPSLVEEGIQHADASGHIPSIATVYLLKALLAAFRSDPAEALQAAERALRLSREYNLMPIYLASCEMLASWARGRLSDPAAGAQNIRNALHDMTEQGYKLLLPICHGLLAELEAVAQHPDAALALIDKGLAIAEETGSHLTDPYLHGLRGDVLWKRDPTDPAPAEQAYQTAIGVAQQQGARSFGLRAALPLARLYQTARPADAHAVLALALEGFSPTPEMPEIAEAQALLAVLAETDEVRADASRRRQRTQLQVAYGNALIAARGLGALETAEAFSKARESATGRKDAPDRLAADYGLWGGSFIRGELSSMRAYAKDFLGDVDARPDSPEAGIANRISGSTHHCAGEYAEALHHLKRALELFQPGRDDDLAFRFGLDAGVAAMACLALALWPLGEIDLAASLIQQMLARMASHVTILAIGNSTRFSLQCCAAIGRGGRQTLRSLQDWRMSIISASSALSQCFSKDGRGPRTTYSAGSKTCAAARNCYANRRFCFSMDS
jgi:tetratricopeptide (TPR) repeat protein